MSLYDILACPICQVHVTRQAESLICPQCARRYPIVNGVPVMLPDGSVPPTEHVNPLIVIKQYSPWLPRLVLQSLLPSSVILDLGAGNTALSLPNVVRMDVVFTPYVDIVGDAHALPFLPGSFDFVFSQSVIEHLRQPFVAAQEMYRVLKAGGYVYGECNFTFPYHGYPHHYFNASQQGLEEAFHQFRLLRSGVGPHQMPSFALKAVIGVYREGLGWHADPEIDRFQALLDNVLAQPLGTYDGRFSEEQAAQTTPAGVFYFGQKAVDEPCQVIPEPLQTAWQNDPALQSQFPDPFNLGVYPNLMTWAKTEAQEPFAEHFQRLPPFRKDPADTPAQVETALEKFYAQPYFNPTFGNFPDVQQEKTLVERVEELEKTIQAKNTHITHLEGLLKSIEAGRVMKMLNVIKRFTSH